MQNGAIDLITAEKSTHWRVMRSVSALVEGVTSEYTTTGVQPCSLHGPIRHLIWYQLNRPPHMLSLIDHRTISKRAN